MNKLLLIDGSGLLVANYYGTLHPEVMSAKTDEEKEKAYKLIEQKNGLYINALYPTIRQIYEMAIKSNCTHVAVTFDKSRKTTFRAKAYADYKGTRKPSPEPLSQQFITCENILKTLGIPVFYSDEFEADDLVGSIAKQLATPEDQVVIYTRDKDYLQLVDKNIFVWMGVYKQEVADTMLDKYLLTPDFGFDEYLPEKTIPYYDYIVKEEKLVEPENFHHVLALMGDTADNIPGVKGVSEEVAQKLISKYKTIDELYKTIKEYGLDGKFDELKTLWKDELDIKRSPIKSLISQEKEARLSEFLAKIKTDIDMNDFIKDFSINDLKCPDSVYDYDFICKNDTREFRKSIKEMVNNQIDDYSKEER